MLIGSFCLSFTAWPGAIRCNGGNKEDIRGIYIFSLGVVHNQVRKYMYIEVKVK